MRSQLPSGQLPPLPRQRQLAPQPRSVRLAWKKRSLHELSVEALQLLVLLVQLAARSRSLLAPMLQAAGRVDHTRTLRSHQPCTSLQYYEALAPACPAANYFHRLPRRGGLQLRQQQNCSQARAQLPRLRLGLRMPCSCSTRSERSCVGGC